jgi:hypothetical protein
MSDDFDKDIARLDQIRRAHNSARPTSENPAWMNTHTDCAFLLSFIDRLWKEYTRTAEPQDAVRNLFNKGIGAQLKNKFSFSFETTEEAEKAFHYIADLGTLQTSRPPQVRTT